MGQASKFIFVTAIPYSIILFEKFFNKKLLNLDALKSY